VCGMNDRAMPWTNGGMNGQDVQSLFWAHLVIQAYQDLPLNHGREAPLHWRVSP
jgi:hypothetical protein